MLKKFFIALFAVSLLVGAATGCRTAEGAGEDLERAGDEIQDVANDLD
jgi:predicted small secreted protein